MRFAVTLGSPVRREGNMLKCTSARNLSILIPSLVFPEDSPLGKRHIKLLGMR